MRRKAPNLVKIVHRLDPIISKDDHNDSVHYFNEFTLRYAIKPYAKLKTNHRTLLYERFIRRKQDV